MPVYARDRCSSCSNFKFSLRPHQSSVLHHLHQRARLGATSIAILFSISSVSSIVSGAIVGGAIDR